MTNSFRGGTGKSTILSNIASSLASHGLKVIIIDGDIISPGIHAMFGLSQKEMDKTLTQYLKKECDIEDIVYDISEVLELPENRLFIVPSSINQKDIAELLRMKDTYEPLLKGIPKLIKAFEPDFIMIDTHPGFNENVLVIASIIDSTLNIVRPDNQDYQGVEVYAQVIKRLGLKLKSYIVMNKVHEKIRNQKLKNQVEKAFRLPVLGMLPNSEDIVLSQSQFIFSQKHPNHPFSLEVESIIENLFGIRPKEHLEFMHIVLEDIKKGKDIIKIWHDHQIDRDKGLFYLQELSGRGFLKQTKKENVYSITPKGEKFLKKYRSIRRFVDEFRL